MNNNVNEVSYKTLIPHYNLLNYTIPLNERRIARFELIRVHRLATKGFFNAHVHFGKENHVLIQMIGKDLSSLFRFFIIDYLNPENLSINDLFDDRKTIIDKVFVNRLIYLTRKYVNKKMAKELKRKLLKVNGELRKKV